jgi:hypothetical protein
VGKFRENDGLDIVNAFLFIVVFAMGCAGVWAGLFWKNRSSEELAEEQAIPSADQPDIPDDALVFRFNNGLKSAAIHVDVAGRLIHFHNCHTPQKFLATAEEWFSCPVDDVQRYSSNGPRYYVPYLTVVTATGKAYVLHDERWSSERGYKELRDTIQELVPFTRPRFLSSDHPMTGMVYFVFGPLVGLFAGVIVTPRNANDATLGLFVLIGTILGVASGPLMVWTCDRFLKSSLVQPIGFSVLGATIGLAIANFIAPWIGWDLLPMAAIVAAGAVFGGVFGIKKQSREQQAVRTTDERRTI